MAILLLTKTPTNTDYSRNFVKINKIKNINKKNINCTKKNIINQKQQKFCELRLEPMTPDYGTRESASEIDG